MARKVKGTKSIRWLLGSTAAITLSTCAIGVAVAQEGAPDEEVVVTAQKRAQDVSKVPVTVQALGGMKLERLGVRDIKGVLAFVPGASQTGETSASSVVYQLRGVATGDTTGDATVASYLDDFAFSIPGVPFGPPSDLFDVQRVEILQGPQGTLYGSSSVGGVIKVVTNDPDPSEYAVRVAGSFGKVENHGYNYSGDVMVNVPLADNLALRAVVSNRHLSGISLVPALGIRDGNEDETFVGRVKLLWEPTEKLSFLASYWHFDDDQDFTNRMDDYDPPAINDTGIGESPSDFNLYTLRATYDLGFAELFSSTGYIVRHTSLTALGQQVDTNFDAHIPGRTTSFVQEVRLTSSGDGPLNWIIGGFYQDGKSASNTFFKLTARPDGSAPNNPSILIDGSSELNSKEYSVFGELSYDLLDGKLRPLIGLRYSQVERVLEQAQTTTIATDPPLVVPSFGESEGKNYHLSPRFNLSYFPSEDGMIYVNIAEGYRPGQLQTGSGVAALKAVLGVETPEQLDTDSLWSYEAGIKWKFFDNDLDLDLSVYHIDWRDAQFQTGSSGISGVINLGDVKGTGVNLTASYRGLFVDGLSAQVAVGWNDTTIDNIPTSVTDVLTFLHNGMQLPPVPEFNAALNLNYAQPINYKDYSFIADARLEYRSDDMDLSTGRRSDDLTLLSAAVGVENETFQIMVFGDNLLGELGPSKWEQGRMLVPRPQTFGIRFTYSGF